MATDSGLIRESLEPFTYFADEFGVIYYSHGIATGGDELATSVYLPANPGSTQVVRWSTGQCYEKVISSGLQIEREELDQLPASPHRDVIRSRYRTAHGGGLEFLGVPHSAIRHVFSPWTAPAAYRADTGIAKGAPKQARAAVRAAVSTFVEASIPEEDIGLYGGLQCGIGRRDGSLHDVDLVVLGNRHADDVMKRCSGNVSRWLPDRILRHDVLHANALTRAKLSQVYIPWAGGELMIDIRTVARPEEHSGAHCAAQVATHAEEVQLSGTVEDISGGLSLPVCYVVRADSGSVFHVVSPNHYVMGSVDAGDRVEVRGIAGLGGRVHINDMSRHLLARAR